jgi:hypothetical protein
LKFAFLPSVKSIENSGFNNNPELTDIFIPNVETLGNDALDSCKLTSLILPKLISVGRSSVLGNPIVFFSALQLKKLSYYVFGSCPHLETVLVPMASINFDFIFWNSPKLNCILAAP